MALSKSYPTLAFRGEKCDGCNRCIEACAQAKSEGEDLAQARLALARDPRDGSYDLVLCRQCADPRCAASCPAGALRKDPETGVVAHDDTRCVDCRLCTLACESGGTVAAPAGGAVMKSDRCGGDPACVRACDRGALTYDTLCGLHNRWGDLEDLFVPGLSACLGCNSELVIRHTLRRVGPNTVLATPPGCVAGVGSVGYNGRTGTKVPVFHPLLTNTAAMLAGVRRYYNRIGRKVTMLAFGGDGGAADVGFQSLSGAAERGEQMIFICLDNEGYMNTGVQRSGTTPFAAWTATTPVGAALRGKTRDAKLLPLLMMMHNCEYVATASAAFMEDYYAKLDKAVEASERGMAYIHFFSPCPTGWRFDTSLGIEVSRKAVEANIFPLWESEAGSGGIRFTRSPEHPLPVKDYLSLVGKYKHLTEEETARIQTIMDDRMRFLKRLSLDRDGETLPVEGEPAERSAAV